MNRMLRGRGVMVLSVVAVLLSAPLAFGGQDSVVKPNEACAEVDTCCPEFQSWCNIGASDVEDHYRSLTDKCPPAEE